MSEAVGPSILVKRSHLIIDTSAYDQVPSQKGVQFLIGIVVGNEVLCNPSRGEILLFLLWIMNG